MQKQILQISLQPLTTNSANLTKPLLQHLKQIMLKLTWKHGLAISMVALMILYRWKLVKVVFPIISMYNLGEDEGQGSVGLPDYIILCSNSKVNLKSLQKLHIPKYIKQLVKGHTKQQSLQIQFYRFDNIEQKLQFSQPNSEQMETTHSKNIDLLFAQTLLNRFKISHIENPKLKVVLIRSSQKILHLFLLKFYGFQISSLHKMGRFSNKKLQILLLNKQKGTYQKSTIQFDNPI